MTLEQDVYKAAAEAVGRILGVSVPEDAPCSFCDGPTNSAVDTVDRRVHAPTCPYWDFFGEEL